MDKLIALIEQIGLPFAYHHFAEGESPSPPFLVFMLPSAQHFSADNRVYYKVSDVRLEVYTDKKDIQLEQRVEALLDEANIYYNKSEVYIESEMLYEVLYQFDMEVISCGK